MPATLTAKKAKKISGKITVPGDKSISHRALILASQAIGRSEISGLLESDDVIHTGEALSKMGVKIEKKKGKYFVDGVGVGGLFEPTDIMDMGNSGTGTRLMMGLVATHAFTSFFTGDSSLRGRPMARVSTPLTQFGAKILSRHGGLLPLAVIGTADPMPIHYDMPVASAQVKSAIMLAGLNAPAVTYITEHEATRDHTELMLKFFGAEVKVEKGKKANYISVKGHPELKAKNIKVPADPSSAAFPAVAALLVKGSSLTITDVCINPLRTGLYTTLKEMGADIKFENTRSLAGEKIADIKIKYSELKGVEVPPERAPSMIDEYPILMVAAACAKGKTVMKGLAELKVKESDRLGTMAENLKKCGVKLSVKGDDMVIEGNGKAPEGGATVKTLMDHRIAMSFAVLGQVSAEPIKIDDSSMIATSFPDFTKLMKSLGANLV